MVKNGNNLKSFFHRIVFKEKLIKKLGIYIAFVVLFIVFAITLKDVGAGFIDTGNLMNILRQTCLYAILAIGMAFVLAAGQIDLSIGSTVGLVSLVAALLIRDYGIWQGVLAGLAVGIFIGAFNGFLVAYLQMPPMIATLGTMTSVAGIGRTLTQLRAVPIQNDFYNYVFGGGQILIFPVSIFWMLAVVVLGHIVIFKTKYGRKVLARGGNERASFYTGINVKRIVFSVMVISSFLAALVGILWAGRFAGGRYSLGEGSETSVIAAAVLGGNSITGGRASILGAAAGAVMMGMLDNALVLYGLDVYQQMIVRGLVIIVAVALTTKRD